MSGAPQYLAVWLVIAAGLSGCDCTSPRGKPWRHEPDPQELAAAEPRSPALARDPATATVLAERGHTLRVQMDARPRAINPLVAPSVWSRRVAMGTIFETLIRYEPPAGGAGAGNGYYGPGLAGSWKIAYVYANGDQEGTTVIEDERKNPLPVKTAPAVGSMQ